jgi:Domain of unknown function (DUF4864)
VGLRPEVRLNPLLPAASRLRALLGALLLSVACAAQAQPLGGEEVRAMRRVIDAQLEAFSRDDHESAFSLASPGIRERFGSAETFVRMVREQYAVVYRPASRTFLKPVVEDGTVIFPVQLSDSAGAVWVALYTMQRVDGEWRVAGCQLVQGAAVST